MKHAVTLVVWADACGGVRSGWRPTHEAAKEAGTVYCVASGHVIKETRRTLVLAPHCALEDDGSVSQVDGELAIPKGWIVHRRTVEVPIPAAEDE
jgi:hypothetical protein